MLTTGAVGRRLQHPGCGEEEISLWKNSMEFLFQSHCLPDISMKKLCHQPIAHITMEWRAQQHAREAVESTTSSATSTTQAMSSLIDSPDEEEHKQLMLIPD